MPNVQKKRNIALLTATITPKSNQPNLLLVDPIKRLQEYCQALEFYSALIDSDVIDGVVFAENSGFELRKLAEKYPSPKIEWLGYDDLECSKNFHRGYGELRLIEKCVRDSKTLERLDENDAVWKISGRYILENMRSVIKHSNQEFDFYCDTRKGWAEMSVFAWSRLGYNSIVNGLSEKLKSDMAPELILAQVISKNSRSDLTLVLKYEWPPFLVGRRGSDGSSYSGRLSRLKHIFLVCGAGISFLFGKVKK